MFYSVTVSLNSLCFTHITLYYTITLYNSRQLCILVPLVQKRTWCNVFDSVTLKKKYNCLLMHIAYYITHNNAYVKDIKGVFNFFFHSKYNQIYIIYIFQRVLYICLCLLLCIISIILTIYQIQL